MRSFVSSLILTMILALAAPASAAIIIIKAKPADGGGVGVQTGSDSPKRLDSGAVVMPRNPGIGPVSCGVPVPDDDPAVDPGPDQQEVDGSVGAGGSGGSGVGTTTQGLELQAGGEAYRDDDAGCGGEDPSNAVLFLAAVLGLSSRRRRRE